MDAALPSLLVMIVILLAGGCLHQTASTDPGEAEQAYDAEYLQAIELLDVEIELNPANATAWCVKGMWLNNYGGRYDAALECYDAALAIDPTYALAWYAKGIALWNLEDYDAADDCFAKAVGLDPSIALSIPSRPDAVSKAAVFALSPDK